MAISMLNIRRPLGRLIFNMGNAIPGKTVFLIETAPWPHEDQGKNALYYWLTSWLYLGIPNQYPYTMPKQKTNFAKGYDGF